MTSHSDALKGFGRKLAFLLMLRGAVQWSRRRVFVWGAVVLAGRLARLAQPDLLVFGLLGAVPLAAAAAVREYRRRFVSAPVRAAYDELNRCGGSSWLRRTPTSRPGRALCLNPQALCFGGGLGGPWGCLLFPPPLSRSHCCAGENDCDGGPNRCRLGNWSVS
jgi:hypothetical protein